MSIGQVIVLAAIVGAFVLFAVTLAWGDYRTQRLVRRIGERDRGDAALPAAATAGKRKDDRAGSAQAQSPKPSADRLKDVA
jgi:hypothetical protein